MRQQSIVGVSKEGPALKLSNLNGGTWASVSPQPTLSSGPAFRGASRKVGRLIWPRPADRAQSIGTTKPLSGERELEAMTKNSPLLQAALHYAKHGWYI
jgi:hypothetical protein